MWISTISCWPKKSCGALNSWRRPDGLPPPSLTRSTIRSSRSPTSSISPSNPRHWTRRTRDYLNTASDELQRAAQIVRQTLGFYRENSAPKNADIGEIVSEVLVLYRRNFMAKEIRVVSEIDAGAVACVVPGEIRQVVANLITNAIDASSAHGEIRVELKTRGDNVSVRVSDRGTGISEENLGHLFEAFFTTKKDLGTGLGLWVSRGLIEKHNGTLTVETSTGQSDHGTTFTILLPANCRADARQAPSI